jgi:Ca-activated chloride channel family protein
MKVKIAIFLLLLLSSFNSVTTRTIRGTITDSSVKPIPGVLVQVKGTKISAHTDLSGNYSVMVPAAGQALRFSLIGMKTIVKSITSDSVVNVTMHYDENNLNEVVVIGYAVQHKRSMNSAPHTTASYSYIPRNRSTEDYNPINENGFQNAAQTPVTTFSADVDRASYSNVRRFLNGGDMPPVDAIRIEEMINYFDYQYPQPVGNDPIAVRTEISDSPWNPGLKLVHIGLQAKTIPAGNLPASNLVFLIDVSGSMADQNKLPLLKQAFKLLVDQLRPTDKVSIVVYAGAPGVVLRPTSGSEKIKIKEAIDNLEAGGSTAGGQGIEFAYKLAGENFMDKGNNRVILATDGDFNVGISSEGELQRLIEEKRKSGIYLSILGFGMGNYKDSHIETLADKGNGNYGYIDNIQEARKMLVQEFGSTLFTVAKDVKLQVEFNPALVQAYRLIGYENRSLKNEDFQDDKKDAGDLGSGHTVTAIYEIVPADIKTDYLPRTDKLKYQTTTASVKSKELMTLKIRYKNPDNEKSELLEFPIQNLVKSSEATSDNFRFATAVAEYGLLLRNSEFKGNARYDDVITRAKGAFGKDEEGYRAEFVKLVKLTKDLDDRVATATK